MNLEFICGLDWNVYLSQQKGISNIVRFYELMYSAVLHISKWFPYLMYQLILLDFIKMTLTHNLGYHFRVNAMSLCSSRLWYQVG